MAVRLLLVVLGLVQAVFGYKYMANCVPGSIAASLEQTKGLIIGYTKALQTILPDAYGSMVLLAAGPSVSCGAASTDINSNLVQPSDITKMTAYYPDMHEVGILKGIKKANVNISYLYVFENKYQVDYEYIANCVPGSVAGSLNQTKGLIIGYTKALQTILPSLYKEMKYMGVTKSAVVSECQAAMDHINKGNASVLGMLKDGKWAGMKEVGLLKGLKVANENRSYLYVFNNGMWNGTWGTMSNGAWMQNDIVVPDGSGRDLPPAAQQEQAAKDKFSGIVEATSEKKLLRI